MTTPSLPLARTTTPQPPRLNALRRGIFVFSGLIPFFIFVLMFQIVPAFSIFTRSFQDNLTGQFTLQHVAELNNPVIVSAFWTTTQISIITSVIGALAGFGLAWAITMGGMPAPIKAAITSFSGVASNFAGLPLVFAFTSTIGRLGILTLFLRDALGISLYPDFKFYGYWGLVIVYLYFQIPLMVLIMVPALESLRKEWSEAAENLGASRWQYWRHVGLPVLAPTIVSTTALLFANAFGTHATAFALVGAGSGQNMIVSILVGAQFRTDTFQNPGLGNAIAFAMVVVMGITILIYTYFRRISARWLSR